MISRYTKELIDSCVAMTITLAIVLTFLWPFMDDGFWSTKLKYIYLATVLGLVWIFLPIIIEIAKAAYKDWRTYKREK